MGLFSAIARRGLSAYSGSSKFCIHQLAASTTEQTNAQIEGWIQRSQKRGGVNFAWITDGLSAEAIQIVVPKAVSQSVPVGSAVRIVGSWQPSSGAQQNMEFLADSVQVLASDSDPRYSTLSPDVLRKKLHLRSKSSAFAAILRLRSQLTRTTHDFFMEKNFVHIDTPVFTANDCEGAGETFSVNDGFFGEKPTYLSVSGQLHLEAVTSGITRAYTFSGAYRADKQQSSSHLTEFKMIEAELAFCDNLDTLLTLVGDYLSVCSNSILSDAGLLKDFNSLGQFSTEEHLKVLELCAKSSMYPRLRYTEAVEILQKHHEQVASGGFNKKNEAFLVEYLKSPVFITHFPSKQKPFYMKRTADNEFTESFDFLCPIVGELAGGSIREPSIEVLKSQGGSIDWYEECRKRGKPISGGFGIGFERLLQVLLGIRNIKDDMVKQKARYLLVQVIPAKDGLELKAGLLFKELIKLIGEMHGDLGFAAVKASITVKIAELDVGLIKIETSVEKYVTTALPFLVSLGGEAVVCRTIFIGRSIRSCEKALIKWRRQELYAAFEGTESGVEKNAALEEIHSISGKTLLQ